MGLAHDAPRPSTASLQLDAAYYQNSGGETPLPREQCSRTSTTQAYKCVGAARAGTRTWDPYIRDPARKCRNPGLPRPPQQTKQKIGTTPENPSNPAKAQRRARTQAFAR
jgi:hypothetical protein